MSGEQLAELAEALKQRCPTCGSDDRAVRLFDDPTSVYRLLCPDGWHVTPVTALLAFELRCDGELIGEETTNVYLAPGNNAWVTLRCVNRIPYSSYLQVAIVVDAEEIPKWWTVRYLVQLDGQPRDTSYRPGRIFVEPSDVGMVTMFPPRWHSSPEQFPNRKYFDEVVRPLEQGMWTLSVRAVR